MSTVRPNTTAAVAAPTETIAERVAVVRTPEHRRAETDSR